MKFLVIGKVLTVRTEALELCLRICIGVLQHESPDHQLLPVLHCG